MEKEKIERKFDVNNYYHKNGVYTCTIVEKLVSEDKKLNIVGEHKDGKTNRGLMKIFPNLEYSRVCNSKLKSVERESLTQYKDLKNIDFAKTKIKILPGDLLVNIKNLEGIRFNDVIEPNLLDGLEKMKQNKIKHGICGDLKKIIQNENFKDFIVQVGNEEFKVHKFLLAARSPVLKEMIENNMDAECLKLIDISKEIFREILSFIYTDELPSNDGINFVHLYAAAGRLKIESLKIFAAEKLIDKVNAENALEILILGNKFESNDLFQKSFEIIKEHLKEDIGEISDDLAMEIEKLKQLLDVKKQKDDMMKKIKQKMTLDLKKIMRKK